MPSPFIFVTDDDQTYVELIKELLTEAGYARVVWHVGNNAFQRIRDEQPDLVLLDINLLNPGRGWTTLDAMRLHPRLRLGSLLLCIRFGFATLQLITPCYPQRGKHVFCPGPVSPQNSTTTEYHMPITLVAFCHALMQWQHLYSDVPKRGADGRYHER